MTAVPTFVVPCLTWKVMVPALTVEPVDETVAVRTAAGLADVANWFGTTVIVAAAPTVSVLVLSLLPLRFGRGGVGAGVRSRRTAEPSEKKRGRMARPPSKL